MILLENLRFHIEEEGKGVDKDGKKVNISFFDRILNCLSLLNKLVVLPARVDFSGKNRSTVPRMKHHVGLPSCEKQLRVIVVQKCT